MTRALRSLGRSRQAGSLAATLAVTAVALAACGGGGGTEDDAASTTASLGEGEPILIKTRVNIPMGKILDGSTIGGSRFCPGGAFQDEHGTMQIGLVARTITCQDGTLRMGFDPGRPVDDTQRGPWRIVSGIGAYEGWKGSGQMELKYDATDNGNPPTRGRETYTGTVTR